jgi:hypothetical protein
MGSGNMELNFRVMVAIEGARSLRFGRYKVDEFSFAVNPEDEAAKYGLQVYLNIKRETGYRSTQLLNVTYNGEHDITETVKKKESEYLTLD